MTSPTPQEVADALADAFVTRQRRFNIHRVTLVQTSGQGPSCFARVLVGPSHGQEELSGTGETMAGAVVSLHNAVSRWLA